MLLVTLLGHDKVKDIYVHPRGFDVLLTTGKIVRECQVMSDTKLSIPQIKGGNRVYTGSEQSFDHCFKQWLDQ